MAAASPDGAGAACLDSDTILSKGAVFDFAMAHPELTQREMVRLLLYMVIIKTQEQIELEGF
jgi:hypothetical protein